MVFQTDFPRFIKAAQYLATGLRADFTTDRYDFYYEMLQDLPIESVIDALQTAGRVCEFFPSPAKIRELASEVMSPQDAAERAWERFRYALQHVTVYDSVDFCDPVLHAVIHALFGGWAQTIDIQSAKLPLIRMDFMKSYVAFAKTGGHIDAPLAGLMPGPSPVVVPSLATSSIRSLPRATRRSIPERADADTE